MAETKPKVRDELGFVDIDQEALIYDPETGSIHHLNPIAKLVFQLFDGRATVSETACGIADAFGANLDDVERDVRTAARDFRSLNLLEVKSARARGGRRRTRSAPTERELIRLESQPST